MFKVTPTYNLTLIKEVYSAQQLENGLTQFLLFDEYTKRWVWMPSSEYIPLNDTRIKTRKNKKVSESE
ncbi:hypothetical protein IFU39_16265 [Paenibacillus sp. CFBP 13594]|uniref:hypothetical protein n=1 Tax=Paenibacillus sp. CFBP 13594 TaxID=2774037 RepID=UPI001784823D|nr:hypothetical protein [Paenibacillus sp. CFBP 13594]MBD8839367.1 hypothetical protein [Paenibacillus sp. CFBP 13594]